MPFADRIFPLGADVVVVDLVVVVGFVLGVVGFAMAPPEFRPMRASGQNSILRIDKLFGLFQHLTSKGGRYGSCIIDPRSVVVLVTTVFKRIVLIGTGDHSSKKSVRVW